MVEAATLTISCLSIFAIFITYFNHVKDLRERVKNLENRMEAIIQKRNEDILGFSDALSSFNKTLAEFNLTVKNLDKTVAQIYNKQQEHDKDIRDIMIKNGK